MDETLTNKSAAGLTTCTPHVATVVLHPKNLPWFVSDVLPTDFTNTLSHLLDPSFFDCDASKLPALHAMVRRWQSYVDDGGWKLAMPMAAGLGEAVGEVAGECQQSFPAHRASADHGFSAVWTNPLPYWALPERAPALLLELQKADLVVFKVGWRRWARRRR